MMSLFNLKVAALHLKVATILEAASECGVNIACMQEAWSKSLPILSSPLWQLALYSNHDQEH